MDGGTDPSAALGHRNRLRKSLQGRLYPPDELADRLPKIISWIQSAGMGKTITGWPKVSKWRVAAPSLWGGPSFGVLFLANGGSPPSLSSLSTHHPIFT